MSKGLGRGCVGGLGATSQKYLFLKLQVKGWFYLHFGKQIKRGRRLFINQERLDRWHEQLVLVDTKTGF